MNETDKRCLNCKHLGAHPSGASICQAHPPAVVVLGMTDKGPATSSVWPAVDPSQDWQGCSEFELQLIKPVAALPQTPHLALDGV